MGPLERSAAHEITFLTLGIPGLEGGGAQIRDYELYRRLSLRHRVRVVAVVEPAADLRGLSTLESWCEDVRVVPVSTRLSPTVLVRLVPHMGARRPVATMPFVQEAALRRVRHLLARWQPDVFQIEHSFLAPYVEAVPEGVDCMTVLSLHNVGQVQYRRMAAVPGSRLSSLSARIKARVMVGWEARLARAFDRVVVVSAADRSALQEAARDLDPRVVPNGVDTRRCTPLPRGPESTDMLFVGNLAYGPNVDAVLWFADEILPRIRRRVPEAALTVVGRDPPSTVRKLACRSGVRIAGEVEDLRPFYRRAAVCVAPIRAGSGSRLKILEAMAYSRAVIATTIGAEGLDCVHGEHLLIADRAGEFAGAVVELLEDHPRAVRLAENARRLVERTYDWDLLSKKLEEAHRIDQSTDAAARIGDGETGALPC